MFKELLHTLFYAEIHFSMVWYVLEYTLQPHMVWGILRKPFTQSSEGSETPGRRFLKLFSQTMTKKPVSSCRSCKDRVYRRMEASL